MGVKIAATQVMIVSVSSVLLALVVVREKAGFVEEGITSGKSARNKVATAAPIATNVPVKAHPSRPRDMAKSPASKATAATAAAIQDQVDPVETLTETSRATASTAATAPVLSASARASC